MPNGQEQWDWKAKSFSTKAAIYHLLTQLDVRRAFAKNISLSPITPKCFIFYVFVSNKNTQKSVAGLFMHLIM